MIEPSSQKAIVDTNILLYCFDTSELSKHQHASHFVGELLTNNLLVLSVQLLNEFFWNVTRPKANIKLPIERATEFVQLLVQAADILPLELSTTLRAIECHTRHSIQIWDALIWAAAKEHGVSLIYTEDFQHNREIDGVRFINPFVAA